MSITVIEIGGHTQHPVGKKLSNFQARPFLFDGIKCGGMEGLLQALKCPDRERQVEICALSGREAKMAGRKFDSWKDKQILSFLGDTFSRCSRGYLVFITRVYDTLYHQDPTLKDDLRSLGSAQMWHSIGNPDMRDTTLTEVEMMMQLERLRHKALREAIDQLVRK
jgi:hypothetical protein